VLADIGELRLPGAAAQGIVQHGLEPARQEIGDRDIGNESPRERAQAQPHADFLAVLYAADGLAPGIEIVPLDLETLAQYLDGRIAVEAGVGDGKETSHAGIVRDM